MSMEEVFQTDKKDSGVVICETSIVGGRDKPCVSLSSLACNFTQVYQSPCAQKHNHPKPMWRQDLRSEKTWVFSFAEHEPRTFCKLKIITF